MRIASSSLVTVLPTDEMGVDSTRFGDQAETSDHGRAVSI